LLDRTQKFTYDELNRIKTAETEANSGSYAWGQCFGELSGGSCIISGYDIWANLKKITVIKGDPPVLNLDIREKNRILNSGFAYDDAGNMTNDGLQAYTYDAENRLTSTAGVSYTYDGDGRRVMKSTGVLYWYGLGCEVLAEVVNGSWQKEYFYVNGQLLASHEKGPAWVRYYFRDHLGSTRVIARPDGGKCYDADYYPFGGERVYLNACPDNYKFTGKERDPESGLDYFLARHYASNLGRFLSTDPASGYMGSPQTWNAYRYALNNPLRYVELGGSLEAPVMPPFHMASAFGPRIHPERGTWHVHKGIDISASTGTPIHAVAEGVVVIVKEGKQGYGKYVVISHGNGKHTLYAHNSMIMVKEGDLVFEGEVIALSGDTGDVTGPHAHFEAIEYLGNVTRANLPLLHRVDPTGVNFGRHTWAELFLAMPPSTVNPFDRFRWLEKWVEMQKEYSRAPRFKVTTRILWWAPLEE